MVFFDIPVPNCFLTNEVKVLVIRRLNGGSRYTSTYDFNNKPFLIVIYGVKKLPFFVLICYLTMYNCNTITIYPKINRLT